MSVLEELLGSLSLREFRDFYLFQRPYASPNTAARFRGLVDWKLLESILAKGHDDCWLPKNGSLAQAGFEQTGVVTFNEARRGFLEGRTILVRRAERASSELQSVTDDFVGLFGEEVDIQLYCTPKSEQGLGWHYDREDVFIVQSDGEKEFQIRKNTLNPWPVTMPRDMQFEREVATTEVRCTLSAGDFLYIPAGYWHRARALSDSFHMTVGVRALSAVEFVESIVNELRESALWRQRFLVNASNELVAQNERERLCDAPIRVLAEHLARAMERRVKRRDAKRAS